MDKEFPTIAEQERYWADKEKLEARCEAAENLAASQSDRIARLIGERDQARVEVSRLRDVLADINSKASKLCESVETLKAMMLK